ESTMMGCELPRAVFTGCDLAGAVLSRSRLRGADLRGCVIGGIRASLDDLAGTVLDPEQAAAVLMGEVGIRVVPVGVELAGQ
ncbi:MAG TPA: pentapeptide repeat-containing protein, partial [Candidatus Dormibacteraeota bacterium]|nr:pentapeptide repeat-containing protein [Candidatus Dormibacteraeota bacterium]